MTTLRSLSRQFGIPTLISSLAAVTILSVTSTPATAEVSPNIWAAIDTDSVGGSDFEPNTPLTVTLYDAPGGTILQTANITTDENGQFGQPGNILAMSIEPGRYVEVTSGTTTKALEVADLTFDEMNPDTNTASGRGPAGAQIYLEIGSHGTNPCSDGLWFSGYVSVDESGAWSVDLDQLGSDILPGGQFGLVKVGDEDGDATQNGYHTPTYRVFLLADEISEEEGWWDPDSQVAVSVYTTDGSLIYFGQAATNALGGFTLGYGAHGVDLTPGMRVVVADSDDTLETTLLQVSWDTLDLATGIATGTAPAGTVPCAGGEKYTDEAGTDAGKGLWPLSIDRKGNWSTDLDDDGFPVDANVWGNVIFGRTVATYRPAIQGVHQLQGVVTLLRIQGILSTTQEEALSAHLIEAEQSLTTAKPKTADKALTNFVKNVNSYVKAGALPVTRGDKLTNDTYVIIQVVKSM